jgi:hypothetical protein
MESSLHRALKEQYGLSAGGRSEVVLAGYRVDAIDPNGLVVEIQSKSLSPLRAKLDRLLPEHRVRVVKPVILRKRVVRQASRGGKELSARRSPKLGAMIDLFEDLVGLASRLPDPNLSLEAVGVAIDEVRLPRRRWPGYQVVDRRLTEVADRLLIERPADLWKLLPDEIDWQTPFTTADLARVLERSLWFAQRVAYCLRVSGAAEILGKSRNHRVYRCPDDMALHDAVERSSVLASL